MLPVPRPACLVLKLHHGHFLSFSLRAVNAPTPSPPPKCFPRTGAGLGTPRALRS